MKAVVAAVLLGSSSSSCLAFLLPAAIARSTASSRSPAATAGSCGLKAHISPSRGRRGELGSGSGSGSGSRNSNSEGNSRRVFAGRPSFALGAGEGGGDAGNFGGSVDIFDALTAGDMAFVTKYVQAGGDCTVQDSIGDTPLMVAVESEQTAAVRMLITEGGADVNRASETTGETPLMLAAYYGHTHLAKVLVDEGGAELECRNKKGETALSLACFWGNEDTVEYLLEAGADPNSRNESGERPGDSFDAVFVPAVEENFFTADEEADKAAGAAEAEAEEEEEEDIMFDELEEGGGQEKDVMLDEGEMAKEVVSEAGKGGAGGGGGGEQEGEEEVQGPREAILEMLEKARAGEPVEAA